MSTTKILKLVTSILEGILGIPFIGGILIVSMLWLPLLVMLGLHIATLVITEKEGGPKVGSILGIVTSVIAWIPLVGMLMHMITFIVLLVEALTMKEKKEDTIIEATIVEEIIIEEKK